MRILRPHIIGHAHKTSFALNVVSLAYQWGKGQAQHGSVEVHQSIIDKLSKVSDSEQSSFVH